MKSDFGKNLKISIFGGSHESHVGVSISGLPQGTTFDLSELQQFLDRRAPGNSEFSTPRKEPDQVLVQSGAKEPLTLIIKNTDVRSTDYSRFQEVPRPGHADFTARIKYGSKISMAGGGPFSARMTAPLCIAGGIALQLLHKKGITIGSHIFSIKDVYDSPLDPLFPKGSSDAFPVLDPKAGEKMQEVIRSAKAEHDSVGGIIEAFATGCPVGLGGPMYDGAESLLSSIFFGIPAVKGVEFGAGFESSRMKGSENNDPFILADRNTSAATNRHPEQKVQTATNHHGGILGGITSGMPLIVRVAFKPTPSIGKKQQSVNLNTLQPETLIIKGRHDPCVVLRAVPVVEAALAIGLLDLLMEETL